MSRAGLETVRRAKGPLIAADGGARHIDAVGRVPDAVIGDFDSLPEALRARLPADVLTHVAEQDSTDFEKCLARIRAPLVLGLGFLGPRIDHQLAAFHGLIRLAHQPCLLLGEHQVVFLCPPRLEIALPENTLFSAFPLGAVSARSEGLHWPLEGLDLAPGQIIGTSNRVSATQVSIQCDRPGMLIILPGPAQAAARHALLTAPARWPAPA